MIEDFKSLHHINYADVSEGILRPIAVKNATTRGHSLKLN